MKHWLLNIATAVSLLLCLALVAFWIDTQMLGNSRKYERPVYTPKGRTPERIMILCRENGFTMQFGEAMESKFAGSLGTKYDRWAIPGASLERMSGRRDGRWLGGRGYEAQISHWFAIVALGLPAIAGMTRLIMLRRQGKIRRLCKKCGYDLRASKDRCPECGTAIASPPAVGATA